LKVLTYLSFVLICFSTNSLAEISTEVGNLEDYLSHISFGSEDDGQFKVPTDEQLVSFENVVTQILQQNYELANTIALQLNYEVIEFTDTVSTRDFYILREINPIPSPLANGGGIYVFRPSATYNVAIHAPHPKADRNTNSGAILAFLASDVRYFMMASSHRRSHPEPSTCQNFSDYRPSDAVHNSAHYFFAAHKAMEDSDSTIHYLEYHGFAASFDTIVSQCDTGGNLAIANLSETIPDDNADRHSLMHSLEKDLESEGTIKACIYSTVLDSGPDDKYTRSLGGTTNVPGRYTNGSPSVCNQAARPEDNTHRYVHFEQSPAMRETAEMREKVAGSVARAIAEYYDEMPFEINAGLNDAWYNHFTSGQGFFLTVFPNIRQLFLAWFTFDTQRPPDNVNALLGEPGHRWLTAQGPYEGDTANLTVFVTKGGVFDAGEPVATTNLKGDGTITVKFADCSQALLIYDISSVGITGEIPIERIALDNIPLCESLNAP